MRTSDSPRSFSSSSSSDFRTQPPPSASRLLALRTAKKQQLEIDFGDGTAVGIRLRQKQVKERKIDAIFTNWTAYVQDTLTTEDAAFLQVAAVFRGE